MIGGEKTFIIAEAGVNHNGSIDFARQLIDIAADAGADAVKFQTFKADEIISKSAPKAAYQLNNTDTDESQLDMIRKLELSESEHHLLYEYCKQKGIHFISTPFDSESLKFLVNELNLPYIKIASGEITNAPFLLQIARTGKPIILSTGMSTLGEVEMALSVLAFGYLSSNQEPSLKVFKEAYISKEGQDVLKNKVSLLHCTTEYPASYEDINLRAMQTMVAAYGLPVGLSDHTEGYAVAIAAVALGAKVVEKHFTLGKNMPGPDHKASLEPGELFDMVIAIRQVEKAMGSSLKTPSVSELKNLLIARKSLVAAAPIKKGNLFTKNNISIKRPGDGIPPLWYWNILGKSADRDYKTDQLIETNIKYF